MGVRLGRLATAFVVLAILAGVVAWNVTPPADDVQARVANRAATLGVPVLPPGAVPRMLADAIVATEDERFYEHRGIDGIGLIRAGLDDIANGCLCEGGSTLTEQLVKAVYLGGSDRGVAKAVDAIVAFKTETVIDKKRIMADWMTLAPTGANLYGMAPSACVYFGKPLGSLDLAEYALLAGLPQAPSADDPRTNPANAARRRSEVLAAMLGHRLISRSQAEAARAEPLRPAQAGRCQT